MPAPTSNLVSQNRDAFSSFAPPVKTMNMGTQTSTPAVSGGGSYSNPGGVFGAINNFAKGAISAIQNPSTSRGLFQGITPIANAQTSSPPSTAVSRQSAPAIQTTNVAPPAQNAPVAVPQTNPTNNGYVGANGQYNAPTGNGTPGIWSGVVGNLANTQPTTGAAGTINTLQGISNNQTPAVMNAESDYNKFVQQSPYMIAAQSNPNVAADVASGRSSLLGNIFAQESAAKQAAVTNALTGQGQQITAANEAGGTANTAQGNQLTGQATAQAATQPQLGAFGQGYYKPENAGMGGAGSGSAGVSPSDPFYSTLQSYAELAANGQLSQVPSSVTGNAVLNAQLNQMAKAINPAYSPLASSAIGQQNASQGQTAQGQSTVLSQTLTQLKNVTSPITSLINGAGLNQQNNPFFNSSINAYSSQLQNPAAQASLKAGMAEIKNYASQILGTGGDLTPTAVTALTQSFDPGNFTASQLNDFLANLDNYGQVRLQGFQQTEAGSYGGMTGYSGASANPNPNAVIPQNNPASAVTSNNPVVQGLVGEGMESFGAILNAVHAIAGTVFGK